MYNTDITYSHISRLLIFELPRGPSIYETGLTNDRLYFAVVLRPSGTFPLPEEMPQTSHLISRDQTGKVHILRSSTSSDDEHSLELIYGRSSMGYDLMAKKDNN